MKRSMHFETASVDTLWVLRDPACCYSVPHAKVTLAAVACTGDLDRRADAFSIQSYATNIGIPLDTSPQ